MKGKELLYTVISSFILTVIWVLSNVYHSYVTSTIDPVLKIQIVPIEPNFDSATIDKLKNRQRVEPIAGPLVTQPQPIPSPSPDETQLIPSQSPNQSLEESIGEEVTPTAVPSP